MQSTFKYGDIQNNSLTPNEELNVLIYSTSACVIIYRNYKFLNMIRFFTNQVRMEYKVINIALNTADRPSSRVGK